MLWRVRIGDHHRDHDFASGIAGAGDVVLFTIDEPLIAVEYGRGADVSGVR